MTLHQLEQYRDQRREVAQLRRDIAQLQPSGEIATDSVKGSMTEWPYVERTVIITGVNVRAERRRASLMDVYGSRIARLEQQLLEVEQWVSTLQDSKLRQIVRIHYLQGKSWRGTALRVYGSVLSEDAARKRVARFFEEKI